MKSKLIKIATWVLVLMPTIDLWQGMMFYVHHVAGVLRRML